MRIIPKKVKVKNTVWKCYSMADIVFALVMLGIIFVSVTSGCYVLTVIFGILTAVMLMPTQDGIFYTCILANIRFLLSKKRYKKNAANPKEDIENITALKAIGKTGITEYKGGYFGRVIKIGQKNFGALDVLGQNIDINRLENALKTLDGSKCMDLVKIERPVNFDGFSDELFSKIEDLKFRGRDLGANAVRYDILKKRIDGIDRLNNLKKRFLSEYYVVVYDKSAEETENAAVYAASEIGKTGIETRLLPARETAVFLKYCYSRNFDEREINGIGDEDLLNWVMPSEISFKANSYTVDGVRASVTAVADYPLRVKNAWGADLFNIPGTKAVMHIRPVGKQKAIRRIDKCINEMETRQIISEKASESFGAEIHRDSLVTLLNSLQAENESLLDVTLTITAYNYSGNENYRKAAKQKISVGNFRTSNLYGMQIEGFKFSAPSPSDGLPGFVRGINSSTLAAVFPFVRTFVMDRGGIMLGENMNNGYPFMLNIWKRGNLYQNSNGMIIGKSGSGKSFFLKTLILNEWADGVRIMVLDPEAEYADLGGNLFGDVIDVGNAAAGRINPFHIYRILTEDGVPADPSVVFNTHLKMLESFFKIVLSGADTDTVELINNLTVETYKKKGITSATDCTKFKPEDFPVFSDLLATLKEKYGRKDSGLLPEELRTAEMHLQKFVTGRYSDIWNGYSTLCSDADFTDFNFQSLFATKNNTVANAQMLLVFRFIEQEIINARELNRRGKTLRTLIICDEAHLFIDAKFPVALDFFYSMSKRIRKYDGGFIAATQNIADWNANEELRGKTSAILKNSQYTFIFKLSAPDMKDVLDVYRAGGGFNGEEQRMIISAVTGQAFFMGSSELRTSVKITADGYLKSLFSEKTNKHGEESYEGNDNAELV